MNICAREGCENSFEKAAHNQKYCSNECCRIATNAKIMQRYYENKERRSGRKRVCKTRGCNEVLSRYNMGDYCAACEYKNERDSLDDVLCELKRVL